MLATGLEPLRLGPLGQLWWGSETRARATVAALASAGFGTGANRAVAFAAWPTIAGTGRAIGARAAVAVATGRPTVAVGARRAVAVGASRWTIAAVATITTVAAIAATAAAGQLLGDGFERL